MPNFRVEFRDGAILDVPAQSGTDAKVEAKARRRRETGPDAAHDDARLLVASVKEAPAQV